MDLPVPADAVNHHHARQDRPVARLFLFAQLVFVAAIVCLISFFRHTAWFDTLGVTFVSIFLEALPFMLLGAFIGGIIEIFVSKAMITRIIPAGTLPAILLAAGLGLVFPVCECAIVPVVRRLFTKGLPLGAGIAFLLGGPIVNPLVALSTAVAYGNDPTMALVRLASGYLIAVAMGLLIDRFFSRKTALAEVPMERSVEAMPSLPVPTQIVRALQHGASDFMDICRFLVFGAFVAGVFQTVVARSDMATVFGSLPLSVLAMMTLALLLSLCSEADAFVAASFRTTLPLCAQMAFMVLGPMLDLKLIAMYFRMFKKRLILVLSLSTFGIVFVIMMAGSWMIR